MPVTKQAAQNASRLGINIPRLELLEKRIQFFMKEDYRQAIVVKITRGGITIFEGTYGTNTKEYGVQKDTIFPVASISKPVVSALLLCLQEDGLVNLGDPVSKYLPEFTGGGREKICLWHFLTHSSGLKDEEIYSGAEEYIKKEYGLTPPKEDFSEEAWDKFNKQVCEKMGLNPDAKNDRLNDPEYLISLKLPVNHAPRSHMTYCNYGYQKLKEVIDVVTGEQIDVFAQRRLFNSLGMKDTYWVVPKSKWDRILGRVDRCEGAPWINTANNYENESGSGGMKTTVEDITNFCRMILNNGIFDGERILSKHSIAEMCKNHNTGVPSDGDIYYSSWGLGLNIRGEKKDDSGILRSPRCLDHGGWAGTKIVLDPETDVTAAIFTAEYKQDEKNPLIGIYASMLNILYSALE